MVQSCHGTKDQESMDAMTEDEITEKSGLHISRHCRDSSSPHTPAQEPLETRHCAKRRGQKTMSTLAKLAKEIDETRDIGQTTADCRLAV